MDRAMLLGLAKDWAIAFVMAAVVMLAWQVFEPTPVSEGTAPSLTLASTTGDTFDDARLHGRARCRVRQPGQLLLGDLEPGEEPARLDGAPLDGRLVLRAFAAWPAALGRDAFAVAEVAGRPSPGRVA